MKKIIVVLFAVLLACTTVFFVGCSDKKVNVDINSESNFVQAPIPSSPSVGVTFGATRTVETGEATYIEKEINVEIRPTNADKKIAFSLTWQDENITEDVSQYAEIIHSSPEDQTAYLRVYKSFGNNVIVLKVESVLFPDKFAECDLNYIGFVNDITIERVYIDEFVCSVETTKEIGEYYHLYSGTKISDTNPELTFPRYYYVDYNFSSVLGPVGRSNIVCEIKASTGLYVGDFQIVGGNGGAFSNVRYITADEFFNEMLYADFYDPDVSELSLRLKYSYDDMLSNPLTPYFCNDLHPVVSSADSRDAYKNIVVFGSGNDLISGNVTDDGVDMAKANEEAMENFYFILTIKDNITGVSEDIKIVISPSVESIEAPESIEV